MRLRMIRSVFVLIPAAKALVFGLLSIEITLRELQFACE